jgi:hypothetical protein
MFQSIRLRFVLAAAVAVAISAIATGTANADPLKRLPVTLNCGGGAISAVVNGNGEFTPAHDTGSTGVFIPLQFGPQTVVFTDPAGNTTIDNFPASPPKGSAAPPGRIILDCTFHVDVTGPDGGHLVVDGQVTGFFSGK